MIRPYENFRDDNWDEHLVEVEVAYNSAVNSVTLCTLFYLNYGMNPRAVPLETLAKYNPSDTEFLENTRKTTKLARDRIILQNISMAKQANITRKKPRIRSWR